MTNEQAQTQRLIGLLQEAAGELNGGDPDHAVALCDEVLAEMPGQPDALKIAGFALCMAGRHDTAIERLIPAAAALPDDPDLLNALAFAQVNAKRNRDAIDTLQKLTALAPEFAAGHNLMGIAQDHLARPFRAAESYRKAIALEPDNPDFYENLIRMGSETAPMIPVLDVAEEAHRRWPDNRDLAVMLGAVYRNLGRADDAARLYEGILASDADNIQILKSLGEAQVDRNEKKSALEIFRRVIGLGGETGDLYYSLARVSDLAPDGPDRPRIETYCRRPDATAGGDFALAAAYEKSGDADAAFRAYETGNRKVRENHPFDLDGFIARLKALQRDFPAQVFEQSADPDRAEDGPIFIIGMPRSGSSLVDQILSAHSQVFGLGETIDVETIAVDLFAARTGDAAVFDQDKITRMGALAVQEPAYFAALGNRIAGVMRALASHGPIVADKQLFNFRAVGLICKALPNAKIVHCRRHPLDTCFSAFQQYFRDNNQPTNGLVELGRGYRAYADLMGHWHRVLPGRIRDIQYEELTHEPETEIRRLLDDLSLPFEEACLSFHRTGRSVRTASRGQVQQKIHRSSVGKWKGYADHLAPLTDELGPLADLA